MTVSNDGKPKVILFGAHWCPHCQREIPLLASALHRDALPANVEMTLVSTGVKSSAPNYPPSKWLSGVQWPTPVIADNAGSSAAKAFGLSAYPYFVFVDGHDKLVARTTYSATHTQTIRGIAPTGKAFSFRTIDIWRVENGKLAEHWDLTDVADVLQKLRE